MVGAVTGTTSSVSSVSSSSKSGSAALEAQLAAKRAELAEAKTDEDKSKINEEISKLKSQLTALKTSEKQDATQTQKAALPRRGEAATVNVTSAEKAAPEAKVPSAVMDVLMKMRPSGGTEDAEHDSPPDLSKLYSDMDSDDDGKVTKNEFVSANANRMSEDDASKLFASIDSENSGSITEDQLAASMPRPGDHPMGPPPEGAGMANGALPPFGSKGTTTA